jgi:hypothetical protein
VVAPRINRLNHYSVVVRREQIIIIVVDIDIHQSSQFVFSRIKIDATHVVGLADHTTDGANFLG